MSDSRPVRWCLMAGPHSPVVTDDVHAQDLSFPHYVGGRGPRKPYREFFQTYLHSFVEDIASNSGAGRGNAAGG